MLSVQLLLGRPQAADAQVRIMQSTLGSIPIELCSLQAGPTGSCMQCNLQGATVPAA